MSDETSKATVVLGGRLRTRYFSSSPRSVCLVFEVGISIGYQQIVDGGVKKSVKGCE